MEKYIENKSYKFKVINDKISISKHGEPINLFYVTDDINIYTVLKFPFQNNYKQPQHLYCCVSYDKKGRIRLKQDIGYILDDIYEEHCVYKFRVTKLPDENESYYKLVDEFGLRHKLFTSNTIKTYILNETIACYVNKISTEKGYLNLHTEEFYALSKHKEVNLIDFEVIDKALDKEGNETYLVKSKDLNIITQIPLFEFQKLLPLPKNLQCLVKSNSSGYTFTQSRKQIITSYYEIEKQYPFDIIEIANSSLGKYYLLQDHFGLEHKLFDSYNQYSFEVNQKIVCNIKSFSENKFLINLAYYEEDSITGLFIPAKRLFDETGLSTYYQEYFADLETDEPIKGSELLKRTFADHNANNNLWIFSYLNYLKFSDCIEFVKLKEMILISIGFDKWILESGFLKSFSKAKRDEIICKTESELQKNICKKEAIQLIIENKQEQFVSEIVNKLDRGAHIINRENNIEILKTILRLDEDILYSQISKLSKLFGLLASYELLEGYDLKSFASILQHRIDQEKNLFDYQCLYNAKDAKSIDSLKNIIYTLCCQILILQKLNSEKQLKIKVSTLCRYLLYLYKEESLMESGLKMIASNCNLSEIKLFAWSDIYNCNLDEIVKSLLNPSLSNRASQPVLLYKNNTCATIESINNQIIYYPRIFNQCKQKTVENISYIPFCNGIIQFAGTLKHKELFFSAQSIEDLKMIWTDLKNLSSWSDLSSKFDLTSSSKSQKPVRVKFTNLHSQKKDLAFFRILDGEYKDFTGCLNTADFYSFPSFEDIFKQDDELYAYISNLDTEKKHIFLSLHNNQEQLRLSLDDTLYTKAIYMLRTNMFDLWLTQESLKCSFYHRGIESPYAIGETYDVKCVDINNEKYKMPGIEILAVSDTKLDSTDIQQQFIRSTILCDESVVEQSDLKFDIIDRSIIKEIIYYIDYYTKKNTIIYEKYNYLNLARILAESISDKSNLFYKAQLYFINTLETYLTSKEITNYKLSSHTLKNFPVLEDLNTCLKILSKTGDQEENSELLRIAEDEASVNSAVARYILAYNLLSNTSDFEKTSLQLKESVYKLLMQEKINSTFYQHTTENEEDDLEEIYETTPLNLGCENQFIEFKTSFVFFAETSSSNLEQQSDVIMKTICGFLNAKGGDLYIGVNDSGSICGIEKDLQELNVNIDKYERLIRQKIVHLFNKDVNSLIEINFSETQGKTYCQITIPSYQMPVTMKNKFWQRQGNETRILEGDDIVKFIQRKITMSTLDNTEKEITTFEQEPSLFDHYKDLKECNTYTHTQEERNKVIAYWNLFNNGSYAITGYEIQSKENLKYDLPITEGDRLSGYLLQCYDNACVNKVPVRTLLEKKQNYRYSNGENSSARLVFACIINTESLLLIRSKRSGIEYLKIYDTRNISAHEYLNLKGNQTIGTKIDTIISYEIVSMDYKNEVRELTYLSSQPIGLSLDKIKQKEINRILNDIPKICKASVR